MTDKSDECLVCEWTRDDCYEEWQSCGSNIFYLDNADPTEAGMNFCCYCGKPLVWTVITND